MIFLGILPRRPADQLLPSDGPADPRHPPPLTAVMVHDVMLVVLRGDLDLASAAELASGCEEVVRQRPRRIVVDLAEVRYLDCASARLIAGLGRALPVGARPSLRQVRPAVLRMLQVTGPDASWDVSG
jgi:anti-sigma B factor antagonist